MLTLFTRIRWYSDCWNERRSVPGERRLCSSLVNRRATLRRARSGEPSVGNAVTAMAVTGDWKRELFVD